MSRHTSVLLGEALTELQKTDPDAAGQIAAHILAADLPGVKRGMAGTGVIRPVRRLISVPCNGERQGSASPRVVARESPQSRPTRSGVA
ncbi:hypothetical protein ACIBL3_46980 [Kribbella sp. NPDC050124]|uniref:hypothetical protein n=1 Tax=Kribbella sp. NPDC050124 TaxID=3364114 RepID=UPI0037B73629